MTLTVTDLFCGGGGSSTGAIQVPGVEIRIAANHWDLAVQVHNENHPTADHAAVDLHEEDPRYFPRTDILWASPECTKWSQASGGKYSSVSTEANLLDLLNPELVDEDPETAIVQPAAAAIDWSMKGTRIGDRIKKPLADKTRRRIAAGIAKYWSTPFHMEQGGNQYDAADPKHLNFGDPNGYYRAWSTLDVLKTLHTMETKALVVPLEGRAGDRVSLSADPLRTQTSRHLDAFVTRAEWGGQTWPVTDAHPTLTTYDTASVIEPPPFIAELRGGGSTARPVTEPASTFTASGNHHGLVMPYYGASTGSEPTSKPIGTLTTVDRYALIQRHNSSKGEGAEMVTPAAEYMRTLTTTAQQSLLTPGDIAAAEAQVDDCLFRMLEPHEVAAGMAFPSDYIWGGTRRERVKLCGNAVTPPAARDLIAAVVEALS